MLFVRCCTSPLAVSRLTSLPIWELWSGMVEKTEQRCSSGSANRKVWVCLETERRWCSLFDTDRNMDNGYVCIPVGPWTDTKNETYTHIYALIYTYAHTYTTRTHVQKHARAQIYTHSHVLFVYLPSSPPPIPPFRWGGGGGNMNFRKGPNTL